jgi:hypothetical protein
LTINQLLAQPLRHSANGTVTLVEKGIAATDADQRQQRFYSVRLRQIHLGEEVQDSDGVKCYSSTSADHARWGHPAGDNDRWETRSLQEQANSRPIVITSVGRDLALRQLATIHL